MNLKYTIKTKNLKLCFKDQFLKMFLLASLTWVGSNLDVAQILSVLKVFALSIWMLAH